MNILDQIAGIQAEHINIRKGLEELRIEHGRLGEMMNGPPRSEKGQAAILSEMLHYCRHLTRQCDLVHTQNRELITLAQEAMKGVHPVIQCSTAEAANAVMIQMVKMKMGRLDAEPGQ